MIIDNIYISTLSDTFEIYSAICSLSDYLFDQSINRKDILQELAKKYANRATVLVAFADGEPKGLCVFYDNNTETKTAFLSMIVVSREVQGQGIGNLLLDKMLEYCKKMECRN